MKKVLTLLLLLILSTPVQAVEMIVPRFQKEINDACKKYFNTNTEIMTAMKCMSSAYINDAYYTKGWTQLIKADVMYFMYNERLINMLNKDRESYENSMIWMNQLRFPLSEAYSHMADTCLYSNDPHKKWTTELLKPLLYGK